MPIQNPTKGVWEEKCCFVEELEQQGERRNDVQSQGVKEFGHMAYGGSEEGALTALRMHIEGRHQREIDRRVEEAR